MADVSSSPGAVALVAVTYPAVSSHGWSTRFSTTLPPLTPYQPTHHQSHPPTAPLPSNSSSGASLHVDEIDDLSEGKQQQQQQQAGSGQRVEHGAAESAAASTVGFGYAYRDELAVPARMAVKERRQLQLTTRGQDKPRPKQEEEKQAEETAANDSGSSSAATSQLISSSISDDEEVQLHTAYVNWLRAEGMLHIVPS